MDADEAERQRIDADEQAQDDTRLPVPPTPGAPSLVAQTKSLGAYPTTAARFYACATAQVFGDEVEGGPGTVTPGTNTLFALNLGSSVPPVGTSVLLTFVEFRWVFRYDQ